MKKETGIIIAGIFGLFAAIGIIALKRFLDNKDYDEDYSDYHRHFSAPQKNEEHHGVEYLSVI